MPGENSSHRYYARSGRRPSDARYPLRKSHALRSPFLLQYLDFPALSELSVTNGDAIVGVIGYEGERPDTLPKLCPFARADLAPIGSGPVFEVWSVPGPVRYHRTGPVRGALTADLAFGIVELDQAPGVSLQRAVSQAYTAIFDFLTETGFETPIRFWNYLPKITGDEDGLERYRRFNIGRYDVFSARLLMPVPPVASAVGGQGGPSLIYFLAAHEPAKTLENPRQVSAYHYPPIYGPRSPRFSRASLFQSDAARTLLISGTASIVGHESLHPDNAEAQVSETLENISALIRAAGQDQFAASKGQWALKAYIRDPDLLAVVRAGVDGMFGTDCQRIFLHADMCRPELLLEIEALCLVNN
jgi:chorismate lyase/3-hydroxybenzoate synthase